MDDDQIVAFWAHHKQVWQDGKGTELMESPGAMDFIEVITKGRKSGEERSVLLSALPSDNGWYVAASNIGRPNHPNWWLNLQAAGNRGTVRVPGGEKTDVEVVELEGQEREEVWGRFKDVQESYVDYEKKTDRHIPVVALRPVK